MVAEQENLYMKWIDLRNRPLLVLILGSSNLNKDHYHQLTKVIGEQKFNSLDFLVQVVTGDPQVGYEIAKFVRERVSGELSCIVPLTLSGAGTVIASSSDEIIGGDITYVGPADVSSIHPSIVSWSECTGQLAPMYFDNEKAYDAHRPEAVDFVKALLDDNPSFTKGHTEEIVEFMTFSPSVDPDEFYRFKSFIDLGVNASPVNHEAKKIFIEFEEVIPQTFSDHILLLQ